jgi:phosphate:Na+ symporter
MPEVMSVLSTLKADNLLGLISCVLIASLITAMIHSSSATIGIVMGLGSAGVLDWQTAVAFSLGADLGTTITSWMASLNLSKNAKRAAYAHISFNIIGVAVTIPLFFPSMIVLTWVMGFFGGDPGIPVMINGKETFPLVPVAVGLYSTFFNIFNTVLLFPFVGVFERVLLKVGHTSAEDVEDYSQPRFLDPRYAGDPVRAIPAIQDETRRYLEAATKFLDVAREKPDAPDNSEEHQAAIDILSREIRQYTAAMFTPNLPFARADVIASLIEEEDFIASLGETLYQVARRVERQPFSAIGRELVNATLDEIAAAMGSIEPVPGSPIRAADNMIERMPALTALRERALKLGEGLPSIERGAILTLLGSAERAFYLIDRIDAERRSVARVVPATATQTAGSKEFPGGAAVPA